VTIPDLNLKQIKDATTIFKIEWIQKDAFAYLDKDDQRPSMYQNNKPRDSESDHVIKSDESAGPHKDLHDLGGGVAEVLLTLNKDDLEIDSMVLFHSPTTSLTTCECLLHE